MTAQIHDQVFHRQIEFSIVDSTGSGLFEPQTYGIEPEMINTACWRGFIVRYAIEDGQLFLTRLNVGLSDTDEQATRAGHGPQLFGHRPRSDKSWGWVYRGLHQPIAFSGSLWLGDRFIEELYLHGGFHPAWKYLDVREVLFEQGRLTADYDRSSEMLALRTQELEQP